MAHVGNCFFGVRDAQDFLFPATGPQLGQASSGNEFFQAGKPELDPAAGVLRVSGTTGTLATYGDVGRATKPKMLAGPGRRSRAKMARWLVEWLPAGLRLDSCITLAAAPPLLAGIGRSAPKAVGGCQEASCNQQQEEEEDGIGAPFGVGALTGRCMLRRPCLAGQFGGVLGACRSWQEAVVNLNGYLVGGLASSSLAVPGSALGVSMAVCPFPFSGISYVGGILMEGVGLADLDLAEKCTAEDLSKGLLVCTFAQGSLGLTRIMLGDVFNGSYTLLLATLGYNSRHPGPGSQWLKTYVLISSINGTMGAIDLLQNMLLHNFPVVAMAIPLKLSMLHMVQIMLPGVSWLGAYFGWQHIKLQKRAAMMSYQRQIAMMLEQQAWPLPPLPFPPPDARLQPAVPASTSS